MKASDEQGDAAGEKADRGQLPRGEGSRGQRGSRSWLFTKKHRFVLPGCGLIHKGSLVEHIWWIFSAWAQTQWPSRACLEKKAAKARAMDNALSVDSCSAQAAL